MNLLLGLVIAALFMILLVSIVNETVESFSWAVDAVEEADVEVGDEGLIQTDTYADFAVVIIGGATGVGMAQEDGVGDGPGYLTLGMGCTL